MRMVLVRVTMTLGLLAAMSWAEDPTALPREGDSFVFREAISRAWTVVNETGWPFPIFSEAISRACTVQNFGGGPDGSGNQPVYREAISRAVTILSTAAPPWVFTEAVSTAYTIDNQVYIPPPPVFTEAISRGWTVENAAGCAECDCNTNGEHDADDIRIGTSRDCNTNSKPDECDIAAGTSLDVDVDGIPDECRTCAEVSIVSQPRSTTVCSGPDVTLAIVATGTSPLAYQWRRDGVGLPQATADRYTIAGAQPADNGRYDATVSNACSSVISDAAILVVWPGGGGDIDGDRLLNGLDIGAFVTEILESPNGAASQAFCAADMDGNGTLDSADVALFVQALVER